MDLKGSGKAGFISGCYNESGDSQGAPVYYFPRIKGATFGEPEALKFADGTLLRVNGIADKRCSDPWAVDWDHDGDLDLIVGNQTGTFTLFRKEPQGFSTKPSYLCWNGPPARWKNYAQDDPNAIKVDRYSGPVLVDLDGDGDCDLVSGDTKGGVRWAENVAGGKEEPRFEELRTLIDGPEDLEPLVRGPLSPGNTPRGRGSRVCVADVNGDEVPDILLGDDLYYFAPTPKETPARFNYFWDDLEKRRAALEREYAELEGQEESAYLRARRKILDAKSRDLDSIRRRLTLRHHDGHVWLFIGKKHA